MPAFFMGTIRRVDNAKLVHQPGHHYEIGPHFRANLDTWKTLRGFPPYGMRLSSAQEGDNRVGGADQVLLMSEARGLQRLQVVVGGCQPQ
jgi:hypothetical protein